MKVKRNIVLVLLLALATAAQAQIFIDDDEFEGTLRQGSSSSDLSVPYQGGDLDQFVPLGEGMLALSLLGGAYLLSKRKKEQ